MTRLLRHVMVAHRRRAFRTVDLSRCALVRFNGRGPVPHTVYARPDGSRVVVVG